jgi:hypothetical protein
MLPQTPSLPAPFFAAVQARQMPGHAVSQQTPSTQKPLAHSAPSVLTQAEPALFFVEQVLVVKSLQYSMPSLQQLLLDVIDPHDV